MWVVGEMLGWEGRVCYFYILLSLLASRSVLYLQGHRSRVFCRNFLDRRCLFELEASDLCFGFSAVEALAFLASGVRLACLRIVSTVGAYANLKVREGADVVRKGYA